MRWSTDVGQVDWIRERLADFMAAQVTSQVPRGFEAYARLLHPVHTQGHERPLRWREVAASSGARLRANSTFEQVAHPHGPPTTMEQRWPGNPRIGALELDEAHRLVGLLSRHTPAEQSCWFGVWEGHGWVWGGVISFGTNQAAIDAVHQAEPPIPRVVRDGPRAELPYRGYLLYTGPITDALALTRLEHPYNLQDALPNIWWPQNRAWFVASEIDADSTYIGGSHALVDQLCATPALEAHRIAPDTRPDHDDTQGGPRPCHRRDEVE